MPTPTHEDVEQIVVRPPKARMLEDARVQRSRELYAVCERNQALRDQVERLQVELQAVGS